MELTLNGRKASEYGIRVWGPPSKTFPERDISTSNSSVMNGDVLSDGNRMKTIELTYKISVISTFKDIPIPGSPGQTRPYPDPTQVDNMNYLDALSKLGAWLYKDKGYMTLREDNKAVVWKVIPSSSMTINNILDKAGVGEIKFIAKPYSEPAVAGEWTRLTFTDISPGIATGILWEASFTNPSSIYKRRYPKFKILGPGWDYELEPEEEVEPLRGIITILESSNGTDYEETGGIYIWTNEKLGGNHEDEYGDLIRNNREAILDCDLCLSYAGENAIKNETNNYEDIFDGDPYDGNPYLSGPYVSVPPGTFKIRFSAYSTDTWDFSASDTLNPAIYIKF